MAAVAEIEAAPLVGFLVLNLRSGNGGGGGDGGGAAGRLPCPQPQIRQRRWLPTRSRGEKEAVVVVSARMEGVEEIRPVDSLLVTDLVRQRRMGEHRHRRRAPPSARRPRSLPPHPPLLLLPLCAPHAAHAPTPHRSGPGAPPLHFSRALKAKNSALKTLLSVAAFAAMVADHVTGVSTQSISARS